MNCSHYFISFITSSIFYLVSLIIIRSLLEKKHDIMIPIFALVEWIQ